LERDWVADQSQQAYIKPNAIRVPTTAQHPFLCFPFAAVARPLPPSGFWLLDSQKIYFLPNEPKLSQCFPHFLKKQNPKKAKNHPQQPQNDHPKPNFSSKNARRDFPIRLSHRTADWQSAVSPVVNRPAAYLSHTATNNQAGKKRQMRGAASNSRLPGI
jgi:hypothetical protein